MGPVDCAQRPLDVPLDRLRVSEALYERGVAISPLNSAVVGKNRSRLCTPVSAGHREEEIEEGARILVSVLERDGKGR